MVATTFFARAAVLLAAAAQVAATGSAIVHNQCDFDVYLWSITNVDSEMTMLPANGGEYVEPYRTNPDGGGVSIKMSTTTVCENITQFEYTYLEGSLWYDLSNIDGRAMMDQGVTVVPSDSNCRSVTCPAGTSLCAAAYNVPTDNFATAECTAEANTVVVLCSGAEDTSGSASISSVASSALATASAVSNQVTLVTVSSTSAAWWRTTQSVQAYSTSASTSQSVAQHVSYNVAAPSVTAAPVNIEPVINPFVVIQTTFITHVVTVEERSAPTAAPVVEKRSIHGHRAAHEQPAKRHVHPHAPQA